LVILETLIEHEGRSLSAEVGRQQVLLLKGQTSISISFDWIPDWKGELELVVHVDSEQMVAERDENNTRAWTITVQAPPEGSGFFISQTILSIGGLALLLLFCIGMMFALRQRRPEADAEEWEEEEPEEWETEVGADGPDPALQGEVQPDGNEYLQWPMESEQWWYRKDAQQAWDLWVE
jgi:hypothetical protein